MVMWCEKVVCFFKMRKDMYVKDAVPLQDKLMVLMFDLVDSDQGIPED